MKGQDSFPGYTIQVVGGTLTLPKGRTTDAVFFVELLKAQIPQPKTPLVIELYNAQSELIETVKPTS